ncbi:2-C-methyl-D-erythritol 4-phosphate cytidylyltransferase [Deferribacterales bacterium RsTz2092]|nr:2-C-methyl-D-erythritol 4-phosphate cytidylyltransferase [Deferribacterales bacterium]
MQACSVSAIIPAAGVGKRFSGGVVGAPKKQFFLIDGRPILYHTLKALKNTYNYKEYIVGALDSDSDFVMSAAQLAGVSVKLSVGGADRAETVLNALELASGKYALVHDAVRPFITKSIVERVISAALQCGGAICGMFARDTIKRVKDDRVLETLARDSIFQAHTPQVFERLRLIEAIKSAKQNGIALTDEASAFEYIGYDVAVVASSADNIKITLREDLALAEYLVKR